MTFKHVIFGGTETGRMDSEQDLRDYQREYLEFLDEDVGLLYKIYELVAKVIYFIGGTSRTSEGNDSS